MPNILELFAGAGGLALGLEQAGFNTVGLVEIDKTACATLIKNRPNWNVINGDIQDFVSKGLIDDLKKVNIDVISGGFPCQSFSYAGKRLGLEDTRGTLFYHYADVIKTLKPKMFIAENVRGLTSHDKGNTLKTIIDVFEDLGYILSWKLLNAWEYGVAQKRERIFIIGVRKDFYYKEFEFPEKHTYKPVLRDILMDVPDSPGSIYPEKKYKVLDLVPPGGCWRDLPDDIAREYMKGSYYLTGGRTGIARRISWDEPSLTLTCSPAQGQTERCHPEETRPFTTREYARIQSFPDDWVFEGSTTNIYKQIGNAVPVNLAKEVGLKVIEYINKKK